MKTRGISISISLTSILRMIKFDIKKICLLTIDIEVASEEGFLLIQDEEMLTISIQDYTTKTVNTWVGNHIPHRRMSPSLLPEERDIIFIDWWMNDYLML